MAVLLLFGATGKTGAQFLSQALAGGHSVTAVVRSPAKVTINHPNLLTVAGDIHAPQTIEAAFDRPYDAVVSTLGISFKGPGSPLTEGTKPIIAGMQRHGVKRLLVVSSVGASESNGIGPWWVKLVQRYILKDVLIDKTQQESLIRASGLDWTIIRPPQLTDTPARRQVIRWQGANPVGGRATWKISRADVAAELLRALSDPASIGQAYQVSGAK